MAKEGTTRYYSDFQEKQVANLLGGFQTSNSGAGHFTKGDVICKDASFLIECKTVTKEKESISIKKDWMDKNLKEAHMQALENGAIAINFKPKGENYFVIDENLMVYLMDKLKEDMNKLKAERK